MKAVTRGDIYHRFFETTNPPKPKFFVIVGEDEKNFVGLFFINSRVNKKVAKDERKNDMQMPLKQTDYPFLDYMSFVAAHELLKLPKSLLLEELSTGKTRFKARIAEEDMDMLLDAARNSPLFSPIEKNFFK